MLVAALELLFKLDGEQLIDQTMFLIVFDVFILPSEREYLLEEILRSQLYRQHDQDVLQYVNSIVFLFHIEVVFQCFLHKRDVNLVLLGNCEVQLATPEHWENIVYHLIHVFVGDSAFNDLIVVPI